MGKEIVPIEEGTLKLSALQLLGPAKGFAEEGLWRDLLDEKFAPLRNAYPTRYGFLLLNGIRREIEDARSASGMLKTDLESVGLLGELEESLLKVAKEVVKTYFPDQDPEDDPSSLLLKDVTKFRLKEADDDLQLWKDLKNDFQRPMQSEDDGLDETRNYIEENLRLAVEAASHFRTEKP